MFRVLVPALAVFCLPLAAQAQTLRPATPPQPPPRTAATEMHAPCAMTDGADSCARVLACVGDRGTWFAGRALGRGAGDLSGAMSDGTACTGQWTERNWFGLGQADITCTNGETGRVYFNYQDRWTGTATGSGKMSGGDRIEVWSGNRVPEFLQNSTGLPALPCGETAIPIS